MNDNKICMDQYAYITTDRTAMVDWNKFINCKLPNDNDDETYDINNRHISIRKLFVTEEMIELYKNMKI